MLGRQIVSWLSAMWLAWRPWNTLYQTAWPRGERTARLAALSAHSFRTAREAEPAELTSDACPGLLARCSRDVYFVLEPQSIPGPAGQCFMQSHGRVTGSLQLCSSCKMTTGEPIGGFARIQQVEEGSAWEGSSGGSLCDQKTLKDCELPSSHPNDPGRVGISPRRLVFVQTLGEEKAGATW